MPDKLTDKEFIKSLAETINRLQAENKDLFYKLEGVMHSVDKWLDGDELKQDEVNRAITMREKTLKIVEDLQAENERLKNSLAISKKETKRYITGYKTAKAEAYKDFAERLKAIASNGYWYDYKKCVQVENIVLDKKDYDNLLKELVGDEP